MSPKVDVQPKRQDGKENHEQDAARLQSVQTTLGCWWEVALGVRLILWRSVGIRLIVTHFDLPTGCLADADVATATPVETNATVSEGVGSTPAWSVPRSGLCGQALSCVPAPESIQTGFKIRFPFGDMFGINWKVDFG